MKYISDAEIESIVLIPNTQNSVGVANFTSFSDDLAPLQLFTWQITWGNLALVAHCASHSIGCGFELANSCYDDDLDSDEDPFVGVRIWDVGDKPIVLSRKAYENFCLRVLDFAETVATSEDLLILNDPVWSQIISDREILRSRLSGSM